jgi:hypothetical protein
VKWIKLAQNMDFVACCCKYDNKPFHTIKDVVVIHQLRNYSLVMSDICPWSQITINLLLMLSSWFSEEIQNNVSTVHVKKEPP